MVPFVDLGCIADYEAQRRANAAVAQVFYYNYTLQASMLGEEPDSDSDEKMADEGTVATTAAERRRNRSVEMKRMLGIEDLFGNRYK